MGKKIGPEILAADDPVDHETAAQQKNGNTGPENKDGHDCLLNFPTQQTVGSSRRFQPFGNI
jgi:hypothetical protein